MPYHIPVATSKPNSISKRSFFSFKIIKTNITSNMEENRLNGLVFFGVRLEIIKPEQVVDMCVLINTLGVLN